MSLTTWTLCGCVGLYALREQTARAFLEPRTAPWAQECLRLLPQLLVLRSLLLRFGSALIATAIPLLIFAPELYSHLATPLLHALPSGHQLITTSLIAPFWVPMHLALWMALWLSVPYLLILIWSFVGPALYPHERRTLWPLLLLSVILFYGGAMFAYLIVIPMAIEFFVHILPQGVQMMADMSLYYDFVMELMLAFALAFEVPMIMVGLMMLGVVKRETFTRHRRSALLGSFILAMILTPPDVVSQTLLAVPLYLIFELGLWVARFANFENVKTQ